MASVQGIAPATSAIRTPRSLLYSPHSASLISSLVSVSAPLENGRRVLVGRRFGRISEARVCRAMVQQAAQGAPATYAKEMERLSAKESLLLAFKDSGGFEALVTGKTTEMQSIDVNERITGLERLNPTPRPTTSPYLEGQWNLEWFGTGNPGSLAARFLFQIFPSALANLSKVDVVIKDSYGKTTVNLKLLNSVESKIVLNSRLSVEGPLRLKEEYVEAVLESPKVVEESVPEQLKGAFGQAVSTAQQLPVPVKDAISSGLKIPLNGRFQRMLMISYLDEEILILRDTTGIPEVLSRLDVPPSTMAEPATEYES